MAVTTTTFWQSSPHYPVRVELHNADSYVFEFTSEALDFDFVSSVEQLHSPQEVLKTESYLSKVIPNSFRVEA